MTKKDTEVLLILPFLQTDSTASNRFRSFIQAVRKQWPVQIAQFNYPEGRVSVNGHVWGKVSIAADFRERLLDVRMPFTRLQTVAFTRSGFYGRLAGLLYQLMSGFDIYYSPIKQIDFEATAKGVLIVSGGYFSLFPMALELSKLTGYKLILDYRDTWTYGYSPLGTGKLMKLFKSLRQRKSENKLLLRADSILTVSETIKNYLPAFVQNKTVVVANGCNVTLPDYSGVTETPSIFNIVYAGTLYNDQLKDETFFECFQQFITHKDITKIKLVFAGAADNRLLKTILNKYSLQNIAVITPRVPFAELVPVLQNACAFLQLKYGSRTGIITSKQADYLALQKPILLPMTDHGDIAQSIIENKAGYICNSKEECLAALNELWRKFQNKESFVIEHAADFHYKLSREYEAQKLVAIINELMDEQSSEAFPAHKK